MSPDCLPTAINPSTGSGQVNNVPKCSSLGVQASEDPLHQRSGVEFAGRGLIIIIIENQARDHQKPHHEKVQGGRVLIQDFVR